MISVNKFVDIMERLNENVKYWDKVCDVIGDPNYVFGHAGFDEIIETLAASMGLDEDAENFLYWWIFERECGDLWDDQDTANCGSNLSYAGDLYRYLLGVDFDNEEVVFANKSEDLVPDFQVIHHKRDDTYSISMETGYSYDEAEAQDYLNDLAVQFIDWMECNGYDVKHPIPLTTFTYGLNPFRQRGSLEEIGRAFLALVAGAKVQGVSGQEPRKDDENEV